MLLRHYSGEVITGLQNEHFLVNEFVSGILAG